MLRVLLVPSAVYAEVSQVARRLAARRLAQLWYATVSAQVTEQEASLREQT